MTPTPTQIAELTHRLKHETRPGFQNLAMQASTAHTEQTAQIAELKAKLVGAEAEIAALKQGLHRADERLAEVMPLAKFGARVLTTDENSGDIAHEYNFLMLDVDADGFSGTYILEPNIEATITQLLKD